MHLKELIEWLEKQDPKATVKDGFGSPHSDRGYYEDLGFDPVEETTFGAMLAHAKAAMGATFTGWKGGEFTMHEYTDCHIGEYGTCGEEITSAHLNLWLLTANNSITGGGTTYCGCHGSALALAKQFHDTYERLAPSFGYETRPETRDFNLDSANGRLMIAVCHEIIGQNEELTR